MNRSGRVGSVNLNRRPPRRRRPGVGFTPCCRRGAAIAVLLLTAAPANAIIKVTFPVSRIYKESRTVLVAAISAVDRPKRSIQLAVTEASKGSSPGARLRINVAEPAGVLAKAALKEPVVLFVGPREVRGATLIHLADSWVRARREAGGDEPRWTTIGEYEGAASFPGSTSGLVRIVRDLKARRPGIQDWISHEGFLGGIRAVGRLAPKPTFMTACDLNADGLPDLVVGTHDGVRAFVAGAGGYTEATRAWGLAGASARQCASGDLNGDGRADLLLGGALWANRGGRLARLPAVLPLPGESEWSAAALADATDDGRADAVVLDKAGRLVVAANPAAPGKPWVATRRALWKDSAPALAASFSTEWGEDGKLHVMVVRADGIFRYAVGGGPGADFERLTGMPLSAYKWLGPMPIKVVLCTAFDYEGNRRTDFCLVTAGGGVTLANRGYGAFLINRFVHRQFDPKDTVKLPKLPVPLTRGAVAAGGRVRKGRRCCQDLLLLTEDGTLYEMDGGRR